MAELYSKVIQVDQTTALVYTLQNRGDAQAIVRRAEEVLRQLESTRNTEGGGAHEPNTKVLDSGMQMSFFQLDDPALEDVRDRLLDLDIDNLTPIEALNKLHEIRKVVGGKG